MNEKEFSINNFITLKLENKKTQIYINGNIFLQCSRLVLNIPINEVENFSQINSIDEAVDVNKTIWLNQIVQGPEAEPDYDQEHDITPEQEFWGHCSNLQMWCEHDYDTRLLHSNLSFPLLKALTALGDPTAKRVFKEEIVSRFLGGNDTVKRFLVESGFLSYLGKQEISFILDNEDQDNENLLYLGDHFYRELEFRKAHQLLSKYISITHRDEWNLTDQFFKMAICLYRLNEYKEAYDNINKVLKYDNFYNRAKLLKAHLSIRVGQFETAKTLYNGLLIISQDKWIYNNLGFLYTKIESYDEAFKYLEKALELDPRFLVAQVRLGHLYKITGNPVKAEQLFKKTIDLLERFHQNKMKLSNQPVIDKYFLVGDIFKEIGEDDYALRSFKLILKVKPNHSLGQSKVNDIMNTICRTRSTSDHSFR